MAIKIEITGDTWEEIQYEACKVAGLSRIDTGIIDNDIITDYGEDLGKNLQGSGWSYRELVRLWSEINANAHELLVEIATRPAPEGYPWWEVSPSLGIQKGMLGGRMSSIGFALKRAFPGKSNPVNCDYSGYRYMMHPGIAAVFHELATASDD
jgi:hypothetical protein